MKAIITGSAGFIGSHLVDNLLSNDWEVIGIDDFSAGNIDNLNNALKNKKFTNINDSVCSAQIGKLFDGTDVVFHNAASKKNICLKNPHKDLEINAGGTLNLLEYSLKYKVKKFVHASTGSVYGEPVIFPQTEEHPLNPCSFYGVSKLAGERYVNMYHKTFGLDTTILRYFHVFGPRQDNSQDKGGVISIFCHNIKNRLPVMIHGTGEQQRSFTSVNDIIRANRFVVDNNTSGEVYNIASGLKISINEVIDKLKVISNVHVNIQKASRLVGDIDKFDISNEKIKALGFSFITNFEDDLIETWFSL